MSFYDFTPDSLNDSASLTKSIVRNITPKNGQPLNKTSLSDRGYQGQTLTSVDLISAASGKELLGNLNYGNLYRMNITRENLNSLANTVLEGKIGNDPNIDSASLSLEILSRSGVGLQGSRGLLSDFSENLNSKYGMGYSSPETVSVEGLAHGVVDYSGSTGFVGAGVRPVALAQSMNATEKIWYGSRAELLASKLNTYDKNVLINGFNFDIRDTNIGALYDTSSRVYGSVDLIERRISEDLITAPEQKAYISASLIEFLLALLSDSFGPALKISGGFGTQRQNDTPRSSGASNDTITDHAFGRAFDFFSIIPANSDTVERKYQQNISKITTKEGYQQQLNIFLTKLNAMPLHLIPDFICVSSKFVDASYDNMNSPSTVLNTKYPKLKFLKLKRDLTGHDDHIHISFAPSRGGIYNGPGGSLTSSSSGRTPSSTANGIKYAVTPYGAIPDTSLLVRSYVNNPQQISSEDIFYALINVGLFTPEAAAVFVGLANRESQRKLYVVQEKWGAIGLWQISTAIKDGGSGTCDLLIPEKFSTQYWKLALPDKTNLNESSVDAEINARCAAGQPGNGIDKFDKRCWNLTNQVYLLRSKINRKNFKQQITDLPIAPWGDNYLKYGFISSTTYSNMSFEDILSIYQKMTGKSEGTLRSWITEKVSSKSNTKKIDQSNSKTVLENWFDGQKYLTIFGN
jgi:hypothetical protein